MHPYLTVEVISAILLTTLAKLLNCQRSDDSYLKCTSKETQRAGCLNGKCFIIMLNGEREPSCICDSGYAGSRCQELNLELLAIAKPNIYLIIGVVILVLVVAAIVFLICYRKVRGLPLSDVFSKQQGRHLVPNDEEQPGPKHLSISRDREALKAENGHTVDR